MTTQQYFNKVYSIALKSGFNHIQASICASQSSIETGWGRYLKGNNYFGVKATKSWKGKVISFITHENIKGKKVKITSKFRSYEDQKDSILDYKKVMELKFSKSWNSKSIKEAADNLSKGRYGAYATDPKYSQKVYNTALKRVKKLNFPKVIIKSKTKSNIKSKILPLYRPNQSSKITLNILDKYDFLIPKSHKNALVKVLFVRGYYLNSMGVKGKNDRAIYDDAVFVVSPEGVQSFNGNSDPASYRKRIATIKEDQAINYKPGLHGYSRKGGAYPAFRQNKNCTVIRDGVGLDTGMFHVNLHRGGINNTSSAGCLTIPKHQWGEFYSLVNGLLKKHNQKDFYVTLLEYAGDKPPVPISVPNAATTLSEKKISKKSVGLLMVVAIFVSAFLEKVSKWLSDTLEFFGGIL